jgi:LmbE family N-acetylglucosaminyl deacetylase
MNEDLIGPHLFDSHGEPLQVSRLVVASHAGDEVVGCGGLLAKHHDDGAVVVLADPDQQRLERLTTARHLLGSPAYTFLGLPAERLADHLEPIVSALSALITQLRPTELYLPYPAHHHDHLVAYEAGMRSTRRPVAREALPVSVLLYDTGGADVADHPADIRWGVGESLREEDVERLVAAAAVHRSPVAKDLARRARRIGSAHGTPWAEQFALVRTPPGSRRAESVPAPVPVMAGGNR